VHRRQELSSTSVSEPTGGGAAADSSGLFSSSSSSSSDAGSGAVEFFVSADITLAGRAWWDLSVVHQYALRRALSTVLGLGAGNALSITGVDWAPVDDGFVRDAVAQANLLLPAASAITVPAPAAPAAPAEEPASEPETPDSVTAPVAPGEQDATPEAEPAPGANRRLASAPEAAPSEAEGTAGALVSLQCTMPSFEAASALVNDLLVLFDASEEGAAGVLLMELQRAGLSTPQVLCAPGAYLTLDDVSLWSADDEAPPPAPPRPGANPAGMPPAPVSNSTRGSFNASKPGANATSAKDKKAAKAAKALDELGSPASLGACRSVAGACAKCVHLTTCTSLCAHSCGRHRVRAHRLPLRRGLCVHGHPGARAARGAAAPQQRWHRQGQRVMEEALRGGRSECDDL
jgi:hypothetical protein